MRFSAKVLLVIFFWITPNRFAKSVEINCSSIVHKDKEYGEGEGESERPNNQKSIEERLDELEDAMYEDEIGGTDGSADETESVTDRALQESLETLVDEDSKEWVYLDLPKINLKETVVPYKTVQEELDCGFYGRACHDKNDHDYYFDSLKYAEKHYESYGWWMGEMTCYLLVLIQTICLND